jgi:uncharacterized membrane protein
LPPSADSTVNETDLLLHQGGFGIYAQLVRTVALEPTLSNVAILGLLVVVRTFLSWSMSVEIEGQGKTKTRD